MKKSSHKDENTLKDAVLLTALADVPFEGWTADVLARACDRHDALPATVFPNGVMGLLEHFSIWADRQMRAAMEQHDLENMRVRDRVACGVRSRLEVLKPHQQAVSAALACMGMPHRSLRAKRGVWRTADAIWRAAGDRATDYNHYTKRLLLSGVLASTTLYWLADDSEDHAETWGFLDRRIDDVLKVGGWMNRCKDKLAGRFSAGGRAA